jgi:hypothetical protein
MDKIAKKKVVDHVHEMEYTIVVEFRDKYLPNIQLNEISFNDVFIFVRHNVANVEEYKKDPIFIKFMNLVISILDEIKNEDILKINAKILEIVEKNEELRKLRTKIIDLEESFVHNINIFNLYR